MTNNWTRPNRPELDATKVPTAIDIAWTAGLYEGEGNCRNYTGTQRGFMVSIAQKDPELLYWIRDWFGGSIREATKNSCHHLEICGDRGRIFISLIYGFMTTRRKAQIDATGAMEYLGGKSPVGMSSAELNVTLLRYYEEERERRTSPSAKARRAEREAYYNRKSSDPVWVAKKNEKERQRYNSQKEQLAKIVNITKIA